MFTPIHQALGLEPSELSIELIERAVEAGVQETASLDWKRDLYDSRDPAWNDEAAKDIAAMANSGGGWIVFGVVEDKETSVASEFRPIRWNAKEHQRILRTAYSHIGPPVLGLEFFDFPKDDGRVVMMRVPDSREAPHFARKGNDAFVAPRRNGPHTAFMSDREIERGFRERFQQGEDDERQLQFLYEQTGRALDPREGVCIVLVAVPREPASTSPGLSEAEAHRFTSPELCPELIHPKVTWLLKWEHGTLRKGLRQWIVRDDAKSFPSRRFLSNDGAVAGTYRLGSATECDEQSRYFPFGKPNHCMSAHIEAAIIDFLSLLRLYAAERHTNGGYRIRAGLVGIADEPIYIRTSEGHTNLLLDVECSEPIIRFQPLTVGLDPLAPFDEILPVANDLAKDFINQSGLKYLKVMAEPTDSQEN